MIKRIIALLLICSINTVAAQEQKSKRGITNETFIEKGEWLTGASFSYTEGVANNFKLLVLDDMNFTGYTFRVSPMVGYFLKDNLAIGGRLAYSRTDLDLGSINLDLGDDMSFGTEDYITEGNNVDAAIFLRNYLNLFNSRRIGLFNEVNLGYGYGRSRTDAGTGEDATASLQTSHSLNLGVTPGITCFIEDFVAVEASVDVMGLNFNWIDQTTNQVETGTMTHSGANFKINLLSINLGIVFFL